MIKLVTWNVNGIRAREAELLRLLEEEKPDVVLLQEVKATLDQLPPTLYGLMGLPEYHSLWHGGVAGYSGVSAHLRKSTFDRPSEAHPSFDFETRVVEAHARERATGREWVLVSMYVPNGGKDYPAKLAFLEQLARYPQALAGKTFVIAGDLNVARADADVHRSQRKPDAIGQRAEERALFEKLFAAPEGGAGLIDVGRALAPDDKQLFTWWPYWKDSRQRNVGWRIDYVLCPPDLAARAAEHRVRREFGTSDHAPVIVVFDA
jgi:exodeoxyribonuclease-3